MEDSEIVKESFCNFSSRVTLNPSPGEVLQIIGFALTIALTFQTTTNQRRGGSLPGFGYWCSLMPEVQSSAFRLPITKRKLKFDVMKQAPPLPRVGKLTVLMT